MKRHSLSDQILQTNFHFFPNVVLLTMQTFIRYPCYRIHRNVMIVKVVLLVFVFCYILIIVIEFTMYIYISVKVLITPCGGENSVLFFLITCC